MIRRTLAQTRELMASVGGLVGYATDDTRLDAVLNYVQETLLAELNHPLWVERVRFCNYSGCIALPLEYENALRFIIQTEATPIASKWYEFMGYGPGRQDGEYGWVGVPIDRGEWPVVRQPDTEDTGGGQYVRVYSLKDERVSGVAPTVTIRGKDGNGRWVRTYVSGEWIDGEQVSLNGHLEANYATTTTKFSWIESVVKPRTNGGAEVFYVDSDSATHFAARYDYKDTVPMYRIYYCPGVVEDTEFMAVHALCRRRYRPAVDDTDLMLVTNQRALRLGLIAARYELSTDASIQAMAPRFWQQAVAALRAEAEAWYGEQIPKFEAAPHSGFGEPNPVW